MDGEHREAKSIIAGRIWRCIRIIRSMAGISVNFDTDRSLQVSKENNGTIGLGNPALKATPGNWREQPQGDPLSPERFLAVEGFADSRAHSSTAIAELMERYASYLRSFGPPATGSAREMTPEQFYKIRHPEQAWEELEPEAWLEFAEAYAAQKVRETREEQADAFETQRQEIEALKAEVAQLRQERDVWKTSSLNWEEESHENAEEAKSEREARERAERALRPAEMLHRIALQTPAMADDPDTRAVMDEFWVALAVLKEK